MQNTKIYCRLASGEFGLDVCFTILNFNSYHTVGEMIESPKFPENLYGYDELKFTLLVYPNGNNETNKHHVSLFLRSDKPGLLIDCDFYVRKGLGSCESSNHHRFVHTFFEKDFGFSRFLKRGKGDLHKDITSDELETLENILSEDELRIGCRLRIHKSSHPSKHSANFRKLLDEQILTDVELLVGQKKFRAHKAILAARSNVFAAMFEYDMVEEQSNQVIISDITDDVFEDMLYFMYTNEKKNVYIAAEKLFEAAEKYEIKGLKIICEEILCMQLDIENVFNSLSFAHIHHAKNLKNEAINFICTHAVEIMASSSWKDRMLSIPSLLLDEVFCAYVLQYSSSAKSSDKK